MILRITQASVLAVFLFGIVSVVSAQTIDPAFAIECNGKYPSPIQCGFYIEGYKDGATDARNEESHDYKRHRRKFVDRFEEFYKAGYEAGYSSVKPYSKWTNKQKDVYRRGYNRGDNDKDRGISRLPARYEGQYDKEFEGYFRRGYFDGYDQRERRYDFPINNRGRIINNTGATTNAGNAPNTNVGFPRRGPGRFGTPSGSLIWSGRVDHRVNLVLRGNSVRVLTVNGRNLGDGVPVLNGSLPRRQAAITATKRDGRGTVTVIQQPNRVNNYTAIVQIYDGGRGADNYRLEVSWQASNALEAYSSGRLRWRGRVDETVNIRISGDNVENVVLAGRELSNVSQNLDGYLARRRGTVTVKKLRGRGTVTVIEQPSRQNNFVAVIQIYDRRSNDAEYDIEVTW